MLRQCDGSSQRVVRGRDPDNWSGEGVVIAIGERERGFGMQRFSGERVLGGGKNWRAHCLIDESIFVFFTKTLPDEFNTAFVVWIVRQSELVNLETGGFSTGIPFVADLTS